MKKTIFFFASMMTLFVSSCSDMLEVEDKRHLDANDVIGSKTDSLFYAYGIMQAMQEAADMYVVQNEMRGDLVTTTSYSSSYLREMADYTATTANKYDSAYVYYKVINNCNNYIARRDTALYNGSYNVTRNEYAAVHAFRAWAYLQLARMYGKVKFFTHPLTSVSQIDNDQSPMYGISEITAELAPELEKFSGTPVPSLFNFSYIPVDVILGELYLEDGQWLNAAKHYYRYLVDNKMPILPYTAGFNRVNDDRVPPIDMPSISDNWTTSEFVSGIRMASSSVTGKTSELPLLFGYNAYKVGDEDRWLSSQITPSDAYYELADSSYYYYLSTYTNSYASVKYGDARGFNRLITIMNEDGGLSYIPRLYATSPASIRLYRVTTIWLHLAEALNRLGHPDAAFAILKDGMGVHLTASNAPYLTASTRALLASDGPVPFFGDEATLAFGNEVSTMGIHGYGCSSYNRSSSLSGVGGTASVYQMDSVVSAKMHQLEKELGIRYSIVKKTGSDLTLTITVDPQVTANAPLTSFSPVVQDACNEAVMALVPEQNIKLGMTIPYPNPVLKGTVTNEDGEEMEEYELTIPEYTLTYAPMADVINAMEDILCDEYAMELAFEGSRFTDLTRMARHKNADDVKPYGSNFGGIWFYNKIRKNNPSVGKDLTVEKNWYLPL